MVKFIPGNSNGNDKFYILLCIMLLSRGSLRDQGTIELGIVQIYPVIESSFPKELTTQVCNEKLQLDTTIKLGLKMIPVISDYNN